MKDIPALVLVWLLFMMALIGMYLGHFVTQSNTKEEAIRAGVAYYTNDASGKPQFKWKECK